MKILHTAIKALPRVGASLLLLLPGMALMAQNTTYTDTSRTTSPANSEWYNQGWIWFVIIIIAIILILALTRRPGSNITGRDQNKYKDRR